MRIDSLLRKVAIKLSSTSPDYIKRGLHNREIVQSAIAEAEEILRLEYRGVVSAYLMARIPVVLPSPDDDEDEPTAFISLLPGLDLPVWMAIPAEDARGPAGWKQQPDLTPNQLQRVINHQSADIEGRIIAKNKLVILRETALDRGCDPDKPISSVLTKEGKK
jgi:hypothetical protein